jgi:hypothetical protein
MDTIKILLGMTVALLVGALAMSWKNFRQDVRATPKKEMAELQRQIAEIDQQQKQLQEERERLMGGQPLTPKASPSQAVPATPVPEVSPQDVPETGAVFGDDLQPQQAIPETPDKPAMASPEDRAKAIAVAPVVAKIKEWVEDPNLGTFVTIQVMDAAAVKAETVLCVRRGTGILGRLKVSEVDGGEALANPSAVFGDVKPKVGDELIVEPVAP